METPTLTKSKYPWIITLVLLTGMICYIFLNIPKYNSYKTTCSTSKFSPVPNNTISDVRFRPINPPIFRGLRHQSNGTWQPFGPKISMEGYIYSAFYDDRKSLQTYPIVRLIGIAETKDVNMFCIIRYSDEDKTEIIPASRSAIGIGISRHARYFQELIYSCPLNHDRVPTTVSLVDHQDDHPSFLIPVEVPIQPKYPADFGVCVTVLYSRPLPYAIVEWVEVLKILGVSQITVYNNSLHPDTAQVFQHYVREGFIDFRQSYNMIPDPGYLTIVMSMTPVINDCIYRNMYKFRKIIIIDIDEFIVPRTTNNYKDMLTEIDKNQSKGPTYQYIFRNNYFFLDIPGIDQSKKLRTMRHRKKVAISGPGYAVKSFIDPLSCVRYQHHYCWGLTPLYQSQYKNIAVDPRFGLSHHYKVCHLDEYERKNGTCKALIDKAVQDDTMLRFRDKLLPRVNAQLQQLGLDPLT